MQHRYQRGNNCSISACPRVQNESISTDFKVMPKTEIYFFVIIKRFLKLCLKNTQFCNNELKATNDFTCKASITAHQITDEI